MNATHWKHAFFALAAWVGFAAGASCVQGEDGRVGGRIAHPPPRAPTMAISAKGAQQAIPPLPEAAFTPVDQTIADDCPARVWSQNVPDRDCTNDGDCDDGFCDRGHCAAVWTCGERYGQRCFDARTAPSDKHRYDTCGGVCLGGRCRSCQADAECKDEYGDDYICGALGPGYRGRACVPRPLSNSEYVERFTDRKISPLDKAILDDCPPRAWSKHVPARGCTKDAECGDGFCDRGRCAAIWTCYAVYGQRCENDDHCGHRVCTGGRCTSCASAMECERTQNPCDLRFDMKCIADDTIQGARECRGTVGSMPATGPGCTQKIYAGMARPNVPNKACGKDSECGGGLCDRGRCVAAGEWDPSYGRECDRDRGDQLLDRYPIGLLVCRDARWRSCESDAECARLGAATCRPRPRSQVYGCTYTPRPPSSSPLPQPILIPFKP